MTVLRDRPNTHMHDIHTITVAMANNKLFTLLAVRTGTTLFNCELGGSPVQVQIYRNLLLLYNALIAAKVVPKHGRLSCHLIGNYSDSGEVLSKCGRMALVCMRLGMSIFGLA